MATANTDRNLLFGILALQMDFIRRDALIKAMNAWVLEKAKGLGQILVDQNALGSDRHALLEALVQEHLKQHGDDPAQSLAAVSSAGSVREELKEIADPDVHASLANVAAASPADAGSWATHAPSVGTPTSAGLRFRILRPHARGGLGQVSVARDEELRREVALKEIQDRHADEPESRARFLQEAEITGGLEHPGIVPVYGLGSYADGRPFYAMRFIRGESLHDAIARFHELDRHGLPPGERVVQLRQLLGRFLDVCNAIAYAHSRGVLHRDLKPGNVMLGQFGETLVVDWGLAKPLDRPDLATSAEGLLKPASASSSAPTQMGSALGTPQFMSPEQAGGRLDQLGPRSDVYSLGATLYCLLTGKAPFGDEADVGVVLQRVQRGDYPPPRQRNRRVAPALEAICHKAMTLQPEDRYASPRALADDIEHWLADEPVTAYREPVLVRLVRWRKRHRAQVAALSAALLVLAVGAAAFGWWYHQEQLRQATEQARRLARLEQDVAVALKEATTLAERAQTLSDRPHLWESTLRAARNAVQLAESLLVREGQTADPEIGARLQAMRARLETEERDWRLVAQLEESLLNLVELNRQNTDVKKDDAYAKIQVALAVYGLPVGGVPVNQAVARIKDRPRSLQNNVLAALQYCWILAPKEEADKRRWWSAVLLAADDDPWRTEVRAALAKKDVEALKRLVGQPPVAQQPTTFLVFVAFRLPAATGRELLRRTQQAHPGDFWANFGLGLLYANDKVPQWKEATRYFTGALALRPQNAIAHSLLGRALLGEDDLDGAARAFRKAIKLSPGVAEPYANLALVLEKREDLLGASKLLHKALELDPASAEAHCTLAKVLLKLQDLPGALKACRKAIELKSDYALAYSNLGVVLMGQKDLAGARSAYQRALELDPQLAMGYFNLGVLLYDQGELAKALPFCRKAIELDPKDAQARVSLGNVLNKQGDLTGAIQSYKEAITLDPKFALAHYNLALVLTKTEDAKEAIQAYRHASALNFQHVEAPNLYNNLGYLLAQQNDLAGAIQAYRQAIALNPKHFVALNNLGNALKVQNDLDGAAKLYRKALELDPKYAPAHNNLALIYLERGEIAQAVASMKQALKWFPFSDPNRAGITQHLPLLQRLAALESKLNSILSGKEQPASNAERADYAALCQVKHLTLTSARFYEQAFAADPKSADELEPGHRYNAACSAALAASGQGKDAANLDARERSRWRKQALAWLRADLTQWTKRLTDDPSQARAAVRKKLRHWQQDTDLACIRDAGAVAKLPAEERAACRKLWADVVEVLKKAG